MTSECPPEPVRFARAEIQLPGGATPGGVEVVSLVAQEGLLYPGVFVRWGCPYEWLIREGILNVRLTVNERMAYPLAERNANPRDPILLPECWKAGETLSLRVSWTDPTVSTFNRIPFWAEMALGTEFPPVFYDANENRVPRRIADIVPITVLPGSAFASISPAIIRPTAGAVHLQVSPAVIAAGEPQYSFATIRGSGVAGNVGGSLRPGNLNLGETIRVDDLRDVFLGDPLVNLVGPVTVMVNREVWL